MNTVYTQKSLNDLSEMIGYIAEDVRSDHTVEVPHRLSLAFERG